MQLELNFHKTDRKNKRKAKKQWITAIRSRLIRALHFNVDGIDFW